MASSRHTRLRSDKYNANVTKRGAVAPTVDRVQTTSNVSPLLLGFIFFVLVGSTVFQIIRNASSGPIF